MGDSAPNNESRIKNETQMLIRIRKRMQIRMRMCEYFNLNVNVKENA